MLSDLDFALGAQAIYLGPSPAFDQVLTIETNTFGIRKADNLIAFQGSQDLIEFIKDGDAMPMPLDDGFVDLGFYFGMPAVHAWLLAQIGTSIGDWSVGGHSLGGALAMILAFMMAHDATPLRRAVGFGTPRSMSESLCAVARAATPGAEWCNEHDPVWNTTSDPPYGRVFTPSMLTIAPVPSLNPFRYHRVQNYVDGLTLRASPSAGPG